MELTQLLVLALSCLGLPALLLYVFMRARQKHALELRRMDLEADVARTRARVDDAPTKRVALSVIPGGKSAQPGTCATCAHFDHELMQREMAAHTPFALASQHVAPWRSGHQMKTDAEGKHLPMDQQGVPKEIRAITWADMGACTLHEEGRVTWDTCPKYASREASA